MAIIFFSYSHIDENLRDKLEEHLSLLKHQGLIESWHDRRIVAGSNIDDEINENLEKADVILLLVSSSFIASNYCYGREMKRAMERHQDKSARVIPVILRPCDWHTAPFGSLLAAPKDGKAVTTWADQDEAFTDVANAFAVNHSLTPATPLRISDHSTNSMTTDEAVVTSNRLRALNMVTKVRGTWRVENKDTSFHLSGNQEKRQRTSHHSGIASRHAD
jgi:hypothetical protein